MFGDIFEKNFIGEFLVIVSNLIFKFYDSLIFVDNVFVDNVGGIAYE